MTRLFDLWHKWQMAAPFKHKYRPSDFVVSPPDEFHPLLGGDHALALARIFAPKPLEIRQMLKSLRLHLGWSQAFASTVIKVTRDLIRAGQLLKIEVVDHVIMGLC